MSESILFTGEKYGLWAFKLGHERGLYFYNNVRKHMIAFLGVSYFSCREFYDDIFTVRFATLDDIQDIITRRSCIDISNLLVLTSQGYHYYIQCRIFRGVAISGEDPDRSDSFVFSNTIWDVYWVRPYSNDRGEKVG